MARVEVISGPGERWWSATGYLRCPGAVLDDELMARVLYSSKVVIEDL
jgi:hypothetical protein